MSIKYVNRVWSNKRESLRKKCPYSVLLWSAFSHIRTEYGEILHISISPYLVRMRENADKNNSEYGHFSRSEYYQKRIQSSTIYLNWSFL